MKIRTDFVTNSSSSSFVAMHIVNPILINIIKKFGEELCDYYCAYISENEDNSLDIHMEEIYMEMPSNKDEIIPSLISIFSNGEIYITNDDEYNEDFPNPLEELEEETLPYEIYINRKKIIDNMTYLQIIYSDMGWQGDSDSRFCLDNYSEETLNQYYKKIAQEKGIDITDVTEEDFFDFVCDKMSTEENTYTYDKTTGRDYCSHDFFVE